MQIAYLTGQEFASTSPRLFLSRVFAGAVLKPITAEDLELDRLHHTLSGVDLLFLTGVSGEHSPYPQILTPPVADYVRAWSADTGANLWMDCAASYYALDHIEYDSPSGVRKSRKGLGWVAGMARGPHIDQHACDDDSLQLHRLHDTLTVPITVHHSSGSLSLDVAYAHSPLLYIDVHDPRNSELKILAHFNNAALYNHHDRPSQEFRSTSSQPVAIAVQPNGHGNILVAGVLPAIQSDDIVFSKTNQHNINPSLLNLYNRLCADRDKHQTMLSSIFEHLGYDYDRLIKRLDTKSHSFNQPQPFSTNALLRRHYS